MHLQQLCADCSVNDFVRKSAVIQFSAQLSECVHLHITSILSDEFSVMSMVFVTYFALVVHIVYLQCFWAW